MVVLIISEVMGELVGSLHRSKGEVYIYAVSSHICCGTGSWYRLYATPSVSEACLSSG